MPEPDDLGEHTGWADVCGGELPVEHVGRLGLELLDVGHVRVQLRDIAEGQGPAASRTVLTLRRVSSVWERMSPGC